MMCTDTTDPNQQTLDLNLNACPLFTDSGEHCHDDEQQFKTDKVARRKLWIASILCVIFMIGEAVGKEGRNTRM